MSESGHVKKQMLALEARLVEEKQRKKETRIELCLTSCFDFLAVQQVPTRCTAPTQSIALSPNEYGKAFFRAVVRDDLDTVSYLLDQGVNIKKLRNGAHQSPLELARERGKVRVTTFLQDHLSSKLARRRAS